LRAFLGFALFDNQLFFICHYQELLFALRKCGLADFLILNSAGEKTGKRKHKLLDC
jgi:hypothetical protein